MLRNGASYGLAVRAKNGSIYARRFPWRSFLRRGWLRLPFIRGFPILLETLANGIHALNLSVEIADAQPVNRLGIFLSMALALGLAALMFIAAPHCLSLAMHQLGLGGDVEGISFHVWDGVFKCAIFLAYILSISFLPDIKRIFQYHGAEHKVIHAWETGESVNSGFGFGMSRLHPRCGTTFLLFVITLSILLQAMLVPVALAVWCPASLAAKHAWTLLVKIFLVIPVSACAYELIRFAASLPRGALSVCLQAPGLALQRLTTREPDMGQMEVAVVALAVALGPEDAIMVSAPCHTRLDSGFEL